jgi:hypothetical protein
LPWADVLHIHEDPIDAHERAEAVGNAAGIGRRIVAAIVDEDVFRRVGPRRILPREGRPGCAPARHEKNRWFLGDHEIPAILGTGDRRGSIDETRGPRHSSVVSDGHSFR